MAPSWIQMGPALVLVTGLWARANAQSDCINVLIGMASCLSYVTGSSSSPTSSCCSQLASVVQSQPQCLCTALGGGGSALGIDINQTLALLLPSACNVKTPPVSLCGAAHEPATSPVGSPEGVPAGSSNKIPNSPTNSSISGSKPFPPGGTTSVASTTSDANTTKMALQFGVVLFVASYASVLSKI